MLLLLRWVSASLWPWWTRSGADNPSRHILKKVLFYYEFLSFSPWREKKFASRFFFGVRTDVSYDLFLWFWKVSGWVPGASGRRLESFRVSAGGPEVNLSGHEEISDNVGKTIAIFGLLRTSDFSEGDFCQPSADFVCLDSQIGRWVFCVGILSASCS